jgi:hypothetical protein
VVETVGLENRCTRKGTGGSNPSPSAITLKFPSRQINTLDSSHCLIGIVLLCVIVPGYGKTFNGK